MRATSRKPQMMITACVEAKLFLFCVSGSAAFPTKAHYLLWQGLNIFFLVVCRVRSLLLIIPV